MSAPNTLRSFLKLLPATLGVGLLLLFIAAPARALTYTYTFDAITQNDPSGANAAAGETQLRMAVTGESGSNTVTFTFYLDGDVPMSITGIYFYDGDLGINPNTFSGFEFDPVWSRTDKTGVSFIVNQTPQSLPASNFPKPSLVFSAVSTQPRSAAGVNPGESLSITFALASGYDISSVVNALDGWLTDKKFDSGDLVVGLHVQAINGGKSESFVVGKLASVSPVPLPAPPCFWEAASWPWAFWPGAAAGSRRQRHEPC